MADQGITHVLPAFSGPLPGQKPEDHLASYHREVSRTVTTLWREIQNQKAQIEALQAQLKAKGQ